MSKARRDDNVGTTFKAKVALAAIKGGKTLAELAQQLDVHLNKITQWRSQLVEGAAGGFGDSAKAESVPTMDVEDAACQDRGVDVGEGSFALGKAGLWPSARNDRPLRCPLEHPIGAAARDQPGQPAMSHADPALMRRIDELHLGYPFAGSSMLQGLLKAEGHETGRLHVRALMKKMGLAPICLRLNTL